MRRLRGDGGPAGRRDGRTRWTAINACLVPAAALDNQEVITAEGLGARVSCIRCSGRWRSAAARSAASARRASSARWHRSSTGDRRPGSTGAQRPSERPNAAPDRTVAAGTPAATALTRRPGHAPTTSTARTVSTCTRCPETCAGAPAIGRSGTPPTPSARHRPPIHFSPGSPRRHRQLLPPTPATSLGRFVRPRIWPRR